MKEPVRKLALLAKSRGQEGPPGITRTTLSYDKDIMVCHFSMNKGAAIPLHDHQAAQSGYIISGRVKFFREDGSHFIAETGTGYTFSAWEKHGADVLEDSEVIEAFSPMRPEYGV